MSVSVLASVIASTLTQHVRQAHSKPSGIASLTLADVLATDAMMERTVKVDKLLKYNVTKLSTIYNMVK